MYISGEFLLHSATGIEKYTNAKGVILNGAIQDCGTHIQATIVISSNNKNISQFPIAIVKPKLESNYEESILNWTITSFCKNMKISN